MSDKSYICCDISIIFFWIKQDTFKQMKFINLLFVFFSAEITNIGDRFMCADQFPIYRMINKILGWEIQL